MEPDATAPQAHEENEKFNPGWLEDENEHILFELMGSCITPLCSQPGRVVLTPSRLYFQPFNVVLQQPHPNLPDGPGKLSGSVDLL